MVKEAAREAVHIWTSSDWCDCSSSLRSFLFQYYRLLRHLHSFLIYILAALYGVWFRVMMLRICFFSLSYTPFIVLCLLVKPIIAFYNSILVHYHRSYRLPGCINFRFLLFRSLHRTKHRSGSSQSILQAILVFKLNDTRWYSATQYTILSKEIVSCRELTGVKPSAPQAPTHPPPTARHQFLHRIHYSMRDSTFPSFAALPE